MPELKPDQLARLRTIFARSGPFASDRELSALFTDPRIIPWHDRIPDNTPNRAERVVALIEALLNQANTAGENALVLFLRVLAENYDSQDALRSDLITLANELEQAFAHPTHTAFEDADDSGIITPIKELEVTIGYTPSQPRRPETNPQPSTSDNPSSRQLRLWKQIVVIAGAVILVIVVIVAALYRSGVLPISTPTANPTPVPTATVTVTSMSTPTPSETPELPDMQTTMLTAMPKPTLIPIPTPLPPPTSLSVCSTEFHCPFKNDGSDETCKDTVSFQPSRLVSRI